MTFEKMITISEDMSRTIRRYLQIEPENEAECLGEDETITYTAAFENGFEMDIKCCGVQYREGETNTAWSEAVLFHNGTECCCESGEDAFLGDWQIDYGGNSYVVHVVSAKDGAVEPKE